MSVPVPSHPIFEALRVANNLGHSVMTEDLGKHIKRKAGLRYDPSSVRRYIDNGKLVVVDRAGLERRLNPGVKVTPRQIMLPLHPNQSVWQAELEKSLRLIARMVHDPAR